MYRPPIPQERPGGCRWLALDMNVPGGKPVAPVRTGKLVALGDEVRKYCRQGPKAAGAHSAALDLVR